MGGHPIIDTITATKNRRFHPIRQIARLLLRNRRVSEQCSEAQHPCRGPSWLHNLLPVLEPLFAIDPKLLFIEDHIIGRDRPVRSTEGVKLPTSLDELKVWVKEASQPCDCDECAPRLYRLRDHNKHGKTWHRDGGHETQSPRFSYGPTSHDAPLPTLRLRLYGDYEAMRLVRHHIDWLDQTYSSYHVLEGASNVMRLKSLLQIWKSNLTGPDMRHTISPAQLQHLFAHLNNVFFAGAVPSHRKALSTGFSWLPESKKNCFGVSYFNPIIGTQLFLHPKLYRHNSNANDLDMRWRNRIGTILHEMCHAFLKAYTCRSCSMHDHCVGSRGHGRAWQILAEKIEEVATRLLDGCVDMGRFPSLLHDMEGHGRLPSSHDLEVYRFGIKR